MMRTGVNTASSQQINFDWTSSFQPWQWLFRRQTSYGFNRRSFSGASSGRISNHVDILPSLYSNIKCTNSWDPQKTVDQTHHRGIFNFDFSPDGKILLAACEGGSLLTFDPLNAKLINHKNKAHSDCVNCVRFLDSRLFATCSDDTTVALWDARFMKKKVRTLAGHLSWVKNIEYASDIGLLVTSGFDGCVYTWNINNYSETEPAFKHVFHTSGLMRSKLAPDNSRLVISLSRGYIIVIHDLDLTTLETDLQGFKPNMYRLIQMSGEMPIRLEHLEHYNQYFHRRRNRVEFITDFPVDIDAEVIASLQIHPQGWCTLSRSTAGREKSEWTCVHDIQKSRYVSEKCDPSEVHPDHRVKGSGGSCSGEICQSNLVFTSDTVSDTTVSDTPVSDTDSSSTVMTGASNNDDSVLGADQTDDDDVEESSGSVLIDMAIFEELFSSSPSPRRGSGGVGGEQNLATVRIPATAEQPERLVLNSSIVQPSVNQEPSSESTGQNWRISGEPSSGTQDDVQPSQSDPREPDRPVEYVTLRLPAGNRATSQKRGGRRRRVADKKTHIHQNQPRLICYAEEPNVGRGFIKELCFSSDGRLVCSPFGYGVRLLAFNPRCDELCDCLPESPVKMYEVASSMCHSNVVVTSKFSPVHCLLVTGCLNGKASFSQPVF